MYVLASRQLEASKRSKGQSALRHSPDNLLETLQITAGSYCRQCISRQWRPAGHTIDVLGTSRSFT
ncbi:unnamed protein product [Ixodes persulcatus]